MYANTVFLQGMWERTVRDYLGPAGTIRSIKGFHMGRFNTTGDAVTIHGTVRSARHEGGRGLVELVVWSTNSSGVSVGPGVLEATLPLD